MGINELVGIEGARCKQQLPDHSEHHGRHNQLWCLAYNGLAKLAALDASLYEAGDRGKGSGHDVLPVVVDKVGMPRPRAYSISATR